jgi:hypothetical protein
MREFLKERATSPPDYEPETLEASHTAIVSEFDTLLRLYGTGIYLDRNDLHGDLWVRTLQQAIRARHRPTGQFNQWRDALQHLPALALLTVCIASALGAGNESLAARLLSEPQWTDPLQGNEARPAFDVLHTYNVLDADVINKFRPTGNSQWLYPQSHFLKSVTLPLIEWLVGDLAEATELFARTEYRFALATVIFNEPGRYLMRAAGGEFLLGHRNSAQSSSAFWADDFVNTGSPAAWGLGDRFDEDGLAAKLSELTDSLEKQTRWG